MRTELEREYVEYVEGRLHVLKRGAYLLCGDVHRAEDLVQTTITALYQHWPRARRADNIDGYVHRMLLRKHIDEQRRGWSRVRLMADAPDRTVAPATDVEARVALRAALAQLPRTQRTMLVLRFACDMSVEDVAAALRCSPGTVKSHTSRGLAALRRLMPLDELMGERHDLG
ncbi:SigE family RNA polymerase sigma factor [Dactylosporangium sp. AC04546]|uniref:SigE family RNA polymerase sigma factor n=1 Tax=Dactylosporangium sp. AC04546 TaxID=2862460 RepID=UPI001EDF9799|nr:SigE family RNA polymerase sigma factor [Dactylosporangium sp. AC04546]WVK81846.1 SigE family RNA polymerase sigma factor [Dactylosporangium sp. AC04546]